MGKFDMKRFGEILRKCIEENGMSISAFSRKTSLNRGMLYAIFKGKKMPEARLNAMFQANVLTPAQQETLRELWYRDSYGKTFERFLFIKDALAKMDREETAQLPVLPEAYAPQGQVVAINGTARLLEVVRFIIETELTRPEPRIITNFPFATTLDDLVYTLLARAGKEVYFQHFISMEESGESIHNLQNLFAAIRYLKLRYNPLQCQPVSLASKMSAMYPCFFATSRYAVLFHPKSGSGIFLAEPKVVETIARTARQTVPACVSLASFPTNELDLQRMYTQRALLTQEGGGFSWSPCLLFLMDGDLLDKLLMPNHSARSDLLPIIESFYRRLFSNPDAPLFFALEGVEKFAQTGRLHEASQNSAQIAPPAIRAELLRRMHESIKNKKHNILLLNERKLPYPQNFCLDFYESGFCMRGAISDGGDAFSGEYTVFSDNNVMMQDFKNFTDYILSNKFHYQQEWSLQFLDSLAAKCGT
jgi:hypothetical protein